MNGQHEIGAGVGQSVLTAKRNELVLHIHDTEATWARSVERNSM
jgi:hypothetical protein